MNNDTLYHTIQQHLATHPTTLDATAIAQLIRQHAPVISDEEVLALIRRLRAGATALGILEPLLATPGLTDILITGPDHITIATTDNPHPQPTTLTFPNDQAVRELATRLAHHCGQRLDDAHPYANGLISRPDGTRLRVHAILSPPAGAGTCISLRLLNTAHASLDHLHHTGTMPQDITELLKTIVDQRANFLISGGTGSGKTTLLAALINHMNPQHRILCIEDTPELNPHHPGLLPLTARPPNSEGHGEITMSTLLQQALRMRPDRIIVGEIRGKEIVDLLTALNTGHTGGGGTLHANTITDIPSRIEALASLGGLSRSATHSHISASINILIAVSNTTRGRRITQLGTLHTDPHTGIAHTTTVWDHTHPRAPTAEQLGLA
ncbi:TadA family conjugal transfer-associated ATPase [Corynebacterium aquilae]|uniref:Bacterial type II secretion system protein E domain-containing protein n=1 Tax=Corynebacterium aquilae DSM 44791 TaxID=1431546 RepID=A0A1L7CDF9_9CORY|nr:TadA family conjugal transfer-associated ATPase [Corynebacterium aquilae]APT83877.1 hypothetical protein CAQU_00920 [Corynebacterium aquilae DSM 44791]